MEHLPVEVIGNILSRLGAARDVVMASTTCRKWREAWKNHLHTLVFNSNDWSVYHDLSTSRLEILITQMIFETTGLQCLSIIMDDVDEFSAAPVIAWLMYTRETLRQLHYNVRTTPNINILDKCSRQKLEVLSLAHNSITGVEPSYQKFSLPEISFFELHIAMSDAQNTMELTSASLRDIYVEAISLDKCTLEADCLEKLHLKDCTLEVFELISKGTLKYLRIDDVSVIQLDIGEGTENLELRLWGVVFDDEDEVVDLDTISDCFPVLSHLSLCYELRDGTVQYGLQCSSQLENVVVLELGWTVLSDLFSQWVAGLLARCPKLRRLVIYGVVCESKTREECQMLANITSSIVRLMRKYMHVDVHFEYE
ncbi:F-box/RNI-like superfamily protein [Actinidia rufa]|uniref:F-box/RNI-like superfamily protein n=1 Tax=Actinidia rufa TaxID=165716 RepID=A0A7J0FWG0_9ERIC|nr:F-box/RNI-like superfamily protein [Actinidia rufa]